MNSVSMSWAMSAVIAICVTPGLSSLAPRGAAPHRVTLAQDYPPVAVPGSADAQGPIGSGDDDSQAGQATLPDDSDSAQQPPANMQQPPADDSGGDMSTQQQLDDNDDQGATPAAPSSGDDN